LRLVKLKKQIIVATPNVSAYIYSIQRKFINLFTNNIVSAYIAVLYNFYCLANYGKAHYYCKLKDVSHCV